jgi:serpin B
MMNRMPTTPLRVMSATVVVLFAACSSTSPSTPPGQAEARSTSARITTPSLVNGDLATLATDNRHFAWDLYDAVRTSPGNLLFSPVSISIALAMTYGGASNNTAAQMASTLHFSLPPERLHPTFNALDLALEAPPPSGSDPGTYELTLANALWAQNGFPFLAGYLDLLAANYGSGVHLVNFAVPDAARTEINQWVSDETTGKIPALLSTGDVTTDTVFVLTNAVYFHAAWQYPFAPNSPDAAFQTPSGPMQVPMMTATSTFGGTTGTGYTAVDVPYKGGTSLFLIVPDAGTFDAFEAALTFAQLDAIITAPSPMSQTSVALSMPRFAFGSSLRLKDTLSAMGMTDAFTSPPADFSGMDGRTDIFLMDVIHKATISVDENGTLATAATAVIAGDAGGPPLELVVDRPFLFAVLDDATNTILFLGRVLDPSQM